MAINHFKIEDYQSIRLNKCINYVGKDIFQMVFEMGLIIPLNKILREHIQEKKEYSNRQYRNRYSDDQRKLIDAYDVHKGEKFDVSILYKLIQDTNCNIAPEYDKVWITKSSSLEYHLYSIKKARNDLSHCQIALDKTFTQQMIEEYRNLFINLVEAAGVRYGRDLTTEREKYNNIIDEIINCPLMENEIKPLFRKQIHESCGKQMVTQGGQELKEKYIRQSDLNPLTLIDGTNFRLGVQKVYKKLEIRDCGRQSKNILIDSNDILRLNESCETETDLNEAVDLVLLEGPTGSGKTTITKLLLAEWSTNPQSLIKGILDYNLLIYMECRNCNIRSVSQLLCSLMPSTCSNLEEESTNTLSACTILIVIDSLDELNENSEIVVKELLELMKRKNVTGICTMRPSKAQEVFSLLPPGLKRVHLQSRGIPDDQRGSFVEMYHDELRKQKKSDQSTQILIQYLNELSSRLHEHLRYPINLVHLVYLWAIAPEKVKFVTTATELYSSIHEVVQIKLSDRLINNSLTKYLTDDECKKKTMTFLEALYIEAMLNLTYQNFCTLSKNSAAELKNVCKENKLPHNEMLAAFLVTKNVWTGLTMEIEHSISHTDMQEYLAAFCLFKAVENPKYQNMIKKRIESKIQYEKGQKKKISRKVSMKKVSFWRRVSIDPKTPVTDVLNIFFPNLDIPLKNYRNVLKHLSGLFVLNNTMTRNVAKDLVYLFKNSEMEQPEDWLDIYAETKSDKFMVKYLSEMCNDMLSGHIIVRDSRVAAYAKLLTPNLSQSYHGDIVDSSSVVIKAESLIINLKNPPSAFPDLQVLMSHAKNLACPVELHLYHNWRTPQSGATSVVLSETQLSCNIKVVRGSPSSNELRVTYSTLEKLYISIYDDDHARDVLPILNSKDLPRLRVIYMHLKCGDVSSTALVPLNFQNSPSISLFLSDVDDSNVTWVVEVTRALNMSNGEYNCLYLPNNQLTSSGFLDLVNRLYQSNIKILMCIGVTSNINEEEVHEALHDAKEAAKNQLQCDLFWYFSAERMEGW